MIDRDDILYKSVLEILSIQGECSSVSSICGYLRRISQENGAFCEISEPDVARCLVDLRAQGIISEPEEDLWRCGLDVRSKTLWNMLKEGRYRSLARLVKRYSCGYLEDLNLQMAFFLKEEDEIEFCCEKKISNFFEEKSLGDIVISITPYLYKTSFNDLDLLNQDSRSIAYMVFIIHSLNDLVSKDLFFSMIGRISTDSIACGYRDFIGYHGALVALLMDNFRAGMDLLVRLNLDTLPLEATNAYLRGNSEEALKLFRIDISSRRKENRKRQGVPQNVMYIFYLLALLESDSLKNYEEAISLSSWFLKKTGKYLLPSACQGVVGLAQRRLGLAADRDVLNLWFLSEYWENFNGNDPYKIATFWVLEKLVLLLLVQTVDDGVSSRKLISYLENESSGENIEWIKSEKAVLTALLKEKTLEGDYASFYRDTGYVSLAGRFKLKISWEKSLFSLKHYVVDQKLNVAEEDKRIRVAWLVGTEGKKPFLKLKISALEQTLGRSGKWSKGKLVPLVRLLKEPAHGMMSEDLSILYSHKLSSSSSGLIEIDELRCLEGLSSHPLVFSEKDREVPVRVMKKSLSVVLKKDIKGWILKTDPSFDPSKVQRQAMIWWDDHDLCYSPLDRRNRALAIIVGKEGLAIPLEGVPLLMDTLEKLGEIVNIAPALDSMSESVVFVDPDPLPHLQFTPVGVGFRIRFGVRPLGKDTPFFPVSRGRRRVFAVSGGLRQTERVFEKEKEAFQRLLDSSTLLRSWTSRDDVLDVDSVEDTLLLLSELEDLAGSFRPEWPEGQKLSLIGKAQIHQLSLRVKSQKDWLSVDGTIALNDDLVLSLLDVLKSLGRNKGAFVPLGEGAFIQLSSQLRKKLEDLDSLSAKNDTLQVSSMAVPVLEEMTEKITLSGDDRWNSIKGRLNESQRMEISVPLDLNATLRDYQEEGFRWMARLSHWNGGACLADDMGLGKTIQTIALLLYRASMGPAFVVAPTSVCSNWKVECERFAPALNVIMLSSSDREQMVKKAGPLDVVLSSWGLLQQERELLTSREWQTVVLDEAQAIKNPRTRRAQAAFALNTPCRVALTGTPVENRLSELWSLFRFLNPGLLGSSDSFRKKYVIPIEQDGDPRVKHQLKKMIKPFMLRRSKEEVLDELPPLTEVTIGVDLSEEEKAFYEALRRQALGRLTSKKSEKKQERFQILAELTRLRRAACNPRLAVPETSIASSKMMVFIQTLEEIIAGDHKALVFSQFTGHLALVREALDSRGILYQYLDGATPEAQRKKRVDAFQAGEGDCFLISLRAGGLGLNLTAADYVIHLDPWWNPAVEDQASDRAHRFGQDRPVTVYRILSRGTVEEKIVALHRRKRDLAESLLDGTNHTVNLTDKDFIELIGQSMA